MSEQGHPITVTGFEDNHHNAYVQDAPGVMECKVCKASTGGHHQAWCPIGRLEARLEASQQEVGRQQRDVLALTPGGSEFVDSWDNCIEFVRNRLATAGKLAAERNQLRVELAAIGEEPSDG